MRVAHVCRKPCSEGTVAKNVLKHGCGALNIDGSRIGLHTNTTPSGMDRYNAALADQGYRPGSYQKGPVEPSEATGRWPANLVLQHLPGCQCLGAKKVKAITRGMKPGSTGAFGKHGVYGTGEGLQNKVEYGGVDGMETVTTWACQAGCPVVVLDEQSGVTKSTGGRTANISTTSSIYGNGKGLGQALSAEDVRGDPGFGDVGGASRFFKQCTADEDAMSQPVTQDFLDYLHTMIAPEHLDDCCVVTTLTPADYDWSQHADESVHGAVVLGWSSTTPPAWSVELWRVLKPGAHLMLIAPTEQPTGHTGACHVEDQGFEVRDAILLVQESGSLHYVAKASGSERNAGTASLARGLTGETLWYPTTENEDELEELQEALPDLDLTAGVEKHSIPEEFLASFEEGSKRGNSHPTAKPIGIMAALLEGVSEDTTILDPFLGSGATALACLKTGHDCIGIEKEEEYLTIADARVRYWNHELRPWDAAEVESDVDSRPTSKPVSFEDLMGLK